MTDSLAAACATIAGLLPAAEALLAQPDTDGTTGGAKPGSRPPWNGAAASAVMDAHEGLRRLEAWLRREVTGQTGRQRGGSDANTAAAICAIEKLGHAVTAQAVADAVWYINHLARPIQELPAVDEAERPQRISAACPYCRFPMLRVYPRSGQVTCLRWGVCYDGDSQHPVGRVVVSRLDGSPSVAWNDGLVT